MLTEVMGAILVHWVFGSVRFYRWILALMSLNGIVLAGGNQPDFYWFNLYNLSI